MVGPVIFSPREQEYLLLAIESSLALRQLSDFFLWTQGQFQAVLPHQLMVCLQFDAQARLLRTECLHGVPLPASTRRQLIEPVTGLVPRLAQAWSAAAGQPLMLAADGPAATPLLQRLQPELQALGLDNVLLHGTAPLAGGASVFALFGLPNRPGPRQAYFLQLLLPHLHLGLQGLAAGAAIAAPAAMDGAPGQGQGRGQGPGLPLRPASAREREVLHWVREGKSNDEVGQILGISGCTVKNHLQRIYRSMGVSNRTQAVAHGMASRLFDGPR